MFRRGDQIEIANIASEEVKKESKFVVLLSRLFPVILRLAERIALQYLKKRGWIE